MLISPSTSTSSFTKNISIIMCYLHLSLLMIMMITVAPSVNGFVVHKEPQNKYIHDTEEDGATDLARHTDLAAAAAAASALLTKSTGRRAATAGSGNPFSALSNKKCFPLSIPQCKQLGYNSTSYQRTIYNSDAPDTAARYLVFFENELCYEDLLFFICTLYNPVCMENHDQIILPCRTECRKTKHHCKDTLKKFNMQWPTELKCTTLPNYQTDVCLTRESMVSQPSKFDCIF